MMKSYYSFFAAILLCFTFHPAKAQRKILLRTFGKDSIVAGFNSEYYLIEDSCTEIVRHSRFDFTHKKFVGHFKDRNKEDTTKIIAEGNYNEDGQKDGAFVSYYLNGNLQAKGVFQNDQYVGEWAFYHEDGTPELMFRVTNGVISITDAWDKDHKKIVDKGKGKYKPPYMMIYYWAGRLMSGRPDGDWKLYKVDDLDNVPILTEHWDAGKFLGGENDAQTYSDSSHIVLVDTRKLTLTHAEKLTFSSNSCEIVKVNKNYTDAKYPAGNEKLFTRFDEMVDDYIEYFFKNKKAIPSYSENLLIDGEIDETGHLVNLTSDKKSRSYDYMIDCLKRYIPKFEPATAYGKPVRQKIAFYFDFGNSEVKYRYQLLGVPYKI